ncbi:MAG TPA: type II toxin-antitoxin system VapC family toxin [Terriglobales bacterium]|nr:type II toxin-antitoxin system VapC family toxin [Terriglobales bacterium]
MSRIFWDTNIFIYLFEDFGELSKAAASLRTRMLARGDRLLTSTLTLGEILVKPLEAGDLELCTKYEEAIASSSLVIPFDQNAAKIYASIRRDRALRGPDAIQLSCAAAARTDLFVTNDARLQGKQVAGIHFIVPLEQAPL